MTLKKIYFFVCSQVEGAVRTIKHRKAHAWLVFALLLAGAITGQIHAKSSSQAGVTTAFLYNFFKYIEWPKAIPESGAYHLCTTNDDQLGDSLLALKDKTVNNKPLVVRRNVYGEDLKACQMVFIRATEDIAKTIHDLKGLPIVTVSAELGFIDEGGMIGLIEGVNHLRFEINLDVANANGVHISAQLLGLATHVNAGYQPKTELF